MQQATVIGYKIGNEIILTQSEPEKRIVGVVPPAGGRVPGAGDEGIQGGTSGGRDQLDAAPLDTTVPFPSRCGCTWEPWSWPER